MAKKLGTHDSTEKTTNLESSKLLGQENASIAANLLSQEVAPKNKINHKPRIKPTEVKAVEEFLGDSFSKLKIDNESDRVCDKICDNNKNLGKYQGLMSTFRIAVKELEDSRPNEGWEDFFDGDGDKLPLRFVLLVDGIRNYRFTSETDTKTIRSYLFNKMIDRIHGL